MERQQQHHESKRDTNVGRVVMTDEQVETLRKQIAVYRFISKHLFEAYKAQQDLALITPPSTAGPSKKSKRPRWNPTSSQLQILESIFSKSSDLPSKKKIKEIANELSHHGLVSDTNVYNWFQNKRARSKRKKLLQTSTTMLSEGDSGDDKSVKKKDNGGDIQVELDKTTISPESEAPNCRIEELSYEINAELWYFNKSQPPGMDNIFSNSSAANI